MTRLSDLLEDEFQTPEAQLALELAREHQHLLARLVEIREEQGLSQADIAIRLGLSQATISAFERIGNDPHLSTVRRYARALGVMIRHDIDADGCETEGRSHYLSHVGDDGISARATASALAKAIVADEDSPWPSETIESEFDPRVMEDRVFA